MTSSGLFDTFDGSKLQAQGSQYKVSTITGKDYFLIASTVQNPQCYNVGIHLTNEGPTGLVMWYLCYDKPLRKDAVISRDGQRFPLYSGDRKLPERLYTDPSMKVKWWIYDVGDDYLVVGNPDGGPDNRKMWIYSSTPTMSVCTFREICDNMSRKGFRVSRLLVNPSTLADCPSGRSGADFPPNRPAVPNSAPGNQPVNPVL